MSSRSVLPFLLPALAGCALMVQGTSQEVALDSRPPGATFTVGGVSGTTPRRIELPKDDYRITFSLPGYLPRTLELKRQVSAYFYGSIALGFVASAIDIATGAWKEFQTTEVLAVLEPAPGTTERIGVRVTSDPPGAEIWTGDVLHARTPADLELEWKTEERSKELTFRLGGHFPKSLVLAREGEGLHAELEPQPIAARVLVRSTPPGADVRVGGRTAGATPLYLDLAWLPKDPPRVVELKKEGYQPVRRELRGPRDQELAVDLEEVVEILPIFLRAVPAGAELAVDGVPVGRVPERLPLRWSVSLRKHVLSASFPGCVPRQVEVTRAQAGGTLEIRLAPLLPKVP